MLEKYPYLLTRNDIAEIFRIGKQSKNVGAFLRSVGIPEIFPGQGARIVKQDVIDYLESLDQE